MSDAVYVCPDCDFAGCHCPKPNPTPDRIAKAPRAWAIKYYDYPINLRDTGPFKRELELEAEGQSGARVVPVALVELQEGE